MTVYFKSVGHSNVNFEAKCDGELTYEWLYKQVKPYCMSRNIEFLYLKKTNQGTILGGMRIIGEFEVKE